MKDDKLNLWWLIKHWPVRMFVLLTFGVMLHMPFVVIPWTARKLSDLLLGVATKVKEGQVWVNLHTQWMSRPLLELEKEEHRRAEERFRARHRTVSRDKDDDE